MSPTPPIPAARRRRALIGFTSIALAFLAGACGSSGEAADDDVASLGTTPTEGTGSDGTATDGTGTDGTTPVDPEGAMVAFAQCMRDHGIDMDDPQIATDGGVSGGGGVVVISQQAEGPDGTGVPTGPDDDFMEAQEACQPIMDAVVSDIEIDPEVLAEQREQMLDYAACMRDQGVDMPDPVFGDDGSVSINIGDDNGSPAAGVGPGDDDWDAANEACGEILGLPDGPGTVIGAGPVIGVDNDSGNVVGGDSSEQGDG